MRSLTSILRIRAQCLRQSECVQWLRCEANAIEHANIGLLHCRFGESSPKSNAPRLQIAI